MTSMIGAQTKINIFGRNKNNGIEKTNLLIKLLGDTYGFKFVGELYNGLVFEFPFDMDNNSLNHKVFYVCDNGGELNINLINGENECVSAAYATTPKTSVETMAYRVSKCAYREPIDYSFNLCLVLENRTEIID